MVINASAGLRRTNACQAAKAIPGIAIHQATRLPAS